MCIGFLASQKLLAAYSNGLFVLDKANTVSSTFIKMKKSEKNLSVALGTI